MSKKNEIVQLALNYVKRYSFQDLSFSYLAEQLDITKAAIHYYFKNKTDLGVAICETLETTLRAQREDFETHQTRSAYEFFDERLAFITEKDICPIISLQADLNKYDQTLKNRLIELIEFEYQTYAQILARKVDTQQAKLLAQIHLASVKGALIYNRSLDVPFEQTILAKIKTEIDEVEK